MFDFAFLFQKLIDLPLYNFFFASMLVLGSFNLVQLIFNRGRVL